MNETLYKADMTANCGPGFSIEKNQMNSEVCYEAIQALRSLADGKYKALSRKRIGR